jgi:hypothetical protein
LLLIKSFTVKIDVVLDKPFNDTCKEFKALLHFCLVGRATLKMLRHKSKTQFVKQERNTQNAIALLNYLKRIVLHRLMISRQVFTKTI